MCILQAIYPDGPSCIEGLGVGGTPTPLFFLEGGRFMYPDSDIERCLLAGRDPRELKSRTATSFSVRIREEYVNVW